MEELRLVEKYAGGNWFKIDFDSLKKDDIFRMFESTGEPVVGSEGDTAWICLSDAFEYKETYGVESKPIKV